jgi:hypothetical protein
MNVADAIVLMLLAIGDIFLMVHLRQRRTRRIRAERMVRSLQLHLRSELSPNSVVAPRRRLMPRAS